MSTERIACVQLTPETARAVLGAHMYGWLEEYSLPTRVDYWCTVAEQGGRVVGAHAFEVAGSTLYSRSTYALTRVRGVGLGERLWAHSLAFVEPTAVTVTCASVAGKRLIERVQAAHPEIPFRIYHGCL